MAEKRRAGKHPSEALTEVGKARQARHDIRREIQQMEAKSAHDIVEEVGKRGADPAKEEVDEEWVPF